MTAQRSMTDELILAKYGYDKEPWIDPTNPDGQRFATGGEIRFGRTVIQRTFAPRPERIPSRDPFPLEWAGHRYPMALAPQLPDNSEFAPRPEFARPPVNPVLSAFRDLADEAPNQPFAPFIANTIAEFERFPDAVDWDGTPDQVEFARKVLTRLAAVQAVSS